MLFSVRCNHLDRIYTRMIITVKHEEKELKVNPNCYISIIVDYIRNELLISTETMFDLRGPDGNLCKTPEYPPNTNAKEILSPGETYYVEFLDSSKEDSVVKSSLTTKNPN